MEQFTASEVVTKLRERFASGNDVPVPDVRLTRAEFDVITDLLEAREKAVPVAWMHPDLHDGHPYPEECLNQEKIEGWLPLYAHSAKAQPPAASVPSAVVELPAQWEKLSELDCGNVGCHAKGTLLTCAQELRNALAAQENPNG